MSRRKSQPWTPCEGGNSAVQCTQLDAERGWRRCTVCQQPITMRRRKNPDGTMYWALPEHPMSLLELVPKSRGDA